MSKFKLWDHVRVTNPEPTVFDKVGRITGSPDEDDFYRLIIEGCTYFIKSDGLILADPELVDGVPESTAPLKVYLAGPMTGIAEYNFPAFKAAAAYLRTYGYEVFNPAENDLENGFDATGMVGNEAEQHGFSLREALKQDLSWICDHANFIALLDGHHASKGVAAELALANALDVPVFHFTRFNGGIPA